MKHIKIFLITALLAAVIVPVSGCGNSSNSEQASTNTQFEEVATQKSEDALTEREQRLLDRLISITREDFFEPSKVRILEIPVYGGDNVYVTHPHPDEDSYSSGSGEKTPSKNEYAVLRLQGENKAGGTLNHYYAICITEGSLSTEGSYRESYSKRYSTSEYCSICMRAGEYFDLGDDYKTTYSVLGVKSEIQWNCPDGSLFFDIGKVNKAFAAYWKDMGIE